MNEIEREENENLNLDPHHVFARPNVRRVGRWTAARAPTGAIRDDQSARRSLATLHVAPQAAGAEV